MSSYINTMNIINYMEKTTIGGTKRICRPVSFREVAQD